MQIESDNPNKLYSRIFSKVFVVPTNIRNTIACQLGGKAVIPVFASSFFPYFFGGISCGTGYNAFIETPLSKPMMEKEEFRKYVLGNIPLGHLGNPEDLIGAVIYLASESSNMVTGHIPLVDGGWTAE